MSAMRAAHQHSVLHRDLKPENIFLTNDGDGDEQVRVLDFGIAKLAEPASPSSGATTQRGALVGTPCYMAPEQLFGEGEVDHRADIWSLGVIFYEMLTGGRPYEGDNTRQLMKRVSSEPVVPIEAIVPDVPRDVADLVACMLQRERAERLDDLTGAMEVLERHASAASVNDGIARIGSTTRSWK